MPYLIADDLPAEPAGQRFRKLVESPGILGIPGTHNGMAALQAGEIANSAEFFSFGRPARPVSRRCTCRGRR